jgi:ABC-type bacteriocin/lantibiotic exporter with double-glycine peptidase domain
MVVPIVLGVLVVLVVVFLFVKKAKEKKNKPLPKPPTNYKPYLQLLSDIQTVANGVENKEQFEAYLKSIEEQVKLYMQYAEFKDKYEEIIKKWIS